MSFARCYNCKSGEMSEWLKEHAWKVCIRERIEGSNPSLSTILGVSDELFMAFWPKIPVRKCHKICNSHIIQYVVKMLIFG